MSYTFTILVYRLNLFSSNQFAFQFKTSILFFNIQKELKNENLLN